MTLTFYLAPSIEYLRHLRESIKANSRTLALIGQIDHQMPQEAILIVVSDSLSTNGSHNDQMLQLTSRVAAISE